MTLHYTPGSFTKNFSWHRSYRPLYTAVAKGFSSRRQPVSRDHWRAHSGIKDSNRQLIPMNFFLYSLPGKSDDFLLVDQFVKFALTSPYSAEFARLALFAFHIAKSGKWKHSQWHDGRVAGWANDLIREVSSKEGVWPTHSFQEKSLTKFIENRIDGEAVTHRKIFTNYRYMLESAGVLNDGRLQAENLRERWLLDAVQLFWDRQIFDNALSATASQPAFEDTLIDNDVHKMLRCNKDQCRGFARVAFGEYDGAECLDQIDRLKASGAVAA